MNRMKQSLNLLAILMVAMFFCTGCEKKGIVDSIVEMYDDGIETVDKAKSVDDVQKYYDDINKKVEEYKQSHLREMASLDSTVTKIDKAKMLFTKACCIKAYSFDHGYIKNTEGVTIGVDIAGEVLPLESIEGDDGLAEEYGNNNDTDNPLGFTTLTPVYDKYKNFEGKDRWGLEYVTVQNSKGDYIYSDEDAELYYAKYLSLFYMAFCISKYVPQESQDYVYYLKTNLSNIILSLPLDDSFPENIREYANEVFYNHKDEISTLHISERGYGYVKCAYYYKGNTNSLRYFCLKRDKENNGRLIIRSY